jgi:hypothetical protein
MRLLIIGRAPTLGSIEKEFVPMKTSNLVAMMIALMVSIAGFAAIDLLFTQAYASHERPVAELTLGA